MKVIPTEEIEWETVVANARTGHVQHKYVREGEILAGVGDASDCTEALCIAFPPAQFAPGHAGHENGG